MKLIDKICCFIVKKSENVNEINRRNLLIKNNINPDLVCKDVIFINIQNVIIGKGTYINSGHLFAGEKAKITIGNDCAIGYNVHIKAVTHSLIGSTGPNIRLIEKEIIIGSNVWIGDNVFIKEGIVVGDNVIVGANTVVTQNLESNSIYSSSRITKILSRNSLKG